MRPDLLFGVKGVEGIGVELFDRDAKVSRQLRVKGGFEEQLEVPRVGVLSVQVDLDPKVPRHPLHPVDHWDDLGRPQGLIIDSILFSWPFTIKQAFCLNTSRRKTKTQGKNLSQKLKKITSNLKTFI